MTRNFIKAYNTFFDSREGSNDYNIGSEEFYVYLALSKQESFLYEDNRISFEFLMDDMKRKNTKANREKAVATIKSLDEKGVIKFVSEEKTYLVVQFNELHKYDHITSKETDYISGFESVYLDELEELMELSNNNPNVIYLYWMIRAKETDVRAVELGYAVLADIMNVTTRTVQNAVYKLKELELITVETSKKKKNYNELNKYRAINIAELKEQREAESRPAHYLSEEEIEERIWEQEFFLQVINNEIYGLEEKEEEESDVRNIYKNKKEIALTAEERAEAIF